MARVTEPEKIEKIRHATMELIAESGYENMSIAKISERSGVSVGYLYRYYKGKEELIIDLLDSNLQSIKERLIPSDIGRFKSLHDLWFHITGRLFDLANQDKVFARFITKITLGLSIPEKEKQIKKKEMSAVLEGLYNLGRKTGEIADDITSYDVEFILSSMPFIYIARGLEDDKDRLFTEEDVKKVTRLCMNAVK